MPRRAASFADLPKARPEVAAFLAAAKEQPADVTPCLVLADWLEENGDEHDAARAEFVRLQCEAHDSEVPACLRLASIPLHEPRRKKVAREAELQEQHESRWLGPLRERIKKLSENSRNPRVFKG